MYFIHTSIRSYIAKNDVLYCDRITSHKYNTFVQTLQTHTGTATAVRSTATTQQRKQSPIPSQPQLANIIKNSTEAKAHTHTNQMQIHQYTQR